MQYMDALKGISGGPALGMPPSAPAGGMKPPPPDPDQSAPAYDVALDPSWAKLVNPHDHEMRNFLNGITPDERQMLLRRIQSQPQLAALFSSGGGAVKAQPHPGAMPPAIG